MIRVITTKIELDRLFRNSPQPLSKPSTRQSLLPKLVASLNTNLKYYL